MQTVNGDTNGTHHMVIKFIAVAGKCSKIVPHASRAIRDGGKFCPNAVLVLQNGPSLEQQCFGERNGIVAAKRRHNLSEVFLSQPKHTVRPYLFRQSPALEQLINHLLPSSATVSETGIVSARGATFDGQTVKLLDSCVSVCL